MGNNNWRGFEKLAHRILSELNEKADVKHDDHILGYESEIERQIDVSIRANVRGQNILTIVQAKNWATPADINTVGEFSAVVRDVRANRGILVCRSGFTLQAKVYAQNLGIELLNLHDAQSKDWNIEIRIPIIWVEEIPTARIALEYSLDENFNQYDDVFLINDNGEPRISPDRGITGIDIWSTFEDRWNDFTLNRTPGPEHTLEYSDITLYLAVGTDRQNISQSIQWIPINSLSVKYVVEKKVALGYCLPDECRGIWDHIRNSFTVTHFAIGKSPERPNGEWIQVNANEEIAVKTNSAFVVCDRVNIKVDRTQIQFGIRRLDD